MTQVHVEPPPNPIIKDKRDDKSYKYFVKLKSCWDLTSATSDLYELKTGLFDNGDPKEFLYVCEKLQYDSSGVSYAGDGRKDSIYLYSGP